MAEPLVPTLASVIRRANQEALADLHVALPARVERVDLTQGLIDAQPLTKDNVDLGDGTLTPISFPVVTNVPIVWPGAGGMRITFPVAAGDTVLLVFADRSLDVWLASGGEVDPIDPRQHAMSDAIAIPGLRDFAHAWQGQASDGMTVGADEGMQIKITTEDAIFNGGSTPVAKEGSVTAGHFHKIVGTAGPFAISPASVTVSPAMQPLTTDTIAVGAGSQNVKVP